MSIFIFFVISVGICGQRSQRGQPDRKGTTRSSTRTDRTNENGYRKPKGKKRPKKSIKFKYMILSFYQNLFLRNELDYLNGLKFSPILFN